MTLANIFLLLATGIFAGFAGGLLGLGGSFIMTPVQYVLYTDMGLPADTAIKLAFGTSLLVVLPTALSGTLRHARQGAVIKKTAIIMGSSSLLAACGGATLAAHIPGTALRIAFGVLILGSGIRMLFTRQASASGELKENSWLLAAWAIPVGIISGLLGIGGGILLVPLLVLVFKYNIHNAMATSLAIMVFMSAGGALGYIINGLGVPQLPAYSIGYVYLPAFLVLTAASAGMAQIGAITTHRLPARHLRYIFIAVMFYLGIKMLGVFDLLGWPL